MEETMDVSDKRVAISLLINTFQEYYWTKSVKERLRMVKATVGWLKGKLPYFC